MAVEGLPGAQRERVRARTIEAWKTSGWAGAAGAGAMVRAGERGRREPPVLCWAVTARDNVEPLREQSRRVRMQTWCYIQSGQERECTQIKRTRRHQANPLREHWPPGPRSDGRRREPTRPRRRRHVAEVLLRSRTGGLGRVDGCGLVVVEPRGRDVVAEPAPTWTVASSQHAT